MNSYKRKRVNAQRLSDPIHLVPSVYKMHSELKIKPQYNHRVKYICI